MEQNRIWDYFQNEKINIFDGSYDRLLFLLKNIQQGTKVLNIGVGGGILEKIALSKNIDIYSLDPNEKAIKKLQKLIGKNKAKIGYSQNIPFTNDYFDVVVMSEVLEHLTDEAISKTLKEVNRVLKKDGKFIGTVPYNENLDEQIVVCPKCGEKFHRWGHIQSFDKESLLDMLKKEFPKVDIKIKKFSSMNTSTLKGKLLSLLGFVKYKILKVFGPNSLGDNLYFECYKIDNSK